MHAVVTRLCDAMNRRDLEAFAACLAPDYRSEQPLHPDRGFAGREQARANWAAMFEGVPELQADVLDSASAADSEWTEWHIRGDRTDGTRMELRGTTIMGVRGEEIAWARLYLELVEEGGAGIAESVRRESGVAPDEP